MVWQCLPSKTGPSYAPYVFHYDTLEIAQLSLALLQASSRERPCFLALVDRPHNPPGTYTPQPHA